MQDSRSRVRNYQDQAQTSRRSCEGNTAASSFLTSRDGCDEEATFECDSWSKTRWAWSKTLYNKVVEFNKAKQYILM